MLTHGGSVSGEPRLSGSGQTLERFSGFCRPTVGPPILAAADLSRRPWGKGDQRRLKSRLAAKIGGPHPDHTIWEIALMTRTMRVLQNVNDRVKRLRGRAVYRGTGSPAAIRRPRTQAPAASRTTTT